MNTTSRQGRPAAGDDALRVLGLQAPGILGWLCSSHCAGGSPGKLQKVVCGLALSQPLTASARTLKLSVHLYMNSAAGKRPECDCDGRMQLGTVRSGVGCVPRAQQCPVLCVETSGYTLKPSRNGVSSKACSCGSTVAKLAGHDLASAQRMRHQQRLLCRGGEPGLANSPPAAFGVSNSRTDAMAGIR